MLVYRAVRDPSDVGSGIAEWTLVLTVWLFVAVMGYVFLGIALRGGASFLTPALQRVGWLLEPRMSPRAPVDPLAGLGASNCIRCGSYCGPETGAFIAPMAAALCSRCIRQVHAAVEAGDLGPLECLSYPDAMAPAVMCSFCKRRGMAGVLGWPAGMICRSCLELAAVHREPR